MQVNKLFLGLFVCASLCACSNDETEVITEEVPKVFTGDEAYITVRLADASSLTRATEGNYEYGTADEHSVKNAFFYFYDENGLFVSEGSAWNGRMDGSENLNIEFTSNNVVVLKGLTQKNYPKYMVTVLNKPTDFTYGATLDEMETKLAEGIYATLDNNGSTKDYYIMSTTSYAGQDLAKYFVTEVKETDFRREPVPEGYEQGSDNSVTVYVERLAAKVTLDVDEELSSVTINGKKYYKVKATVAGEGNDNDANAGSSNQTAAEDLYVHFLGWKLNATANNSYMMKNIDENWTNANTNLGFEWNKDDDHRSFWGKSFNYGKSGYPTNAADATGSEYLTYVNLENPLDLGANAYCAENTNTSDIVSANFPSAVTSILLKAEVCGADGKPLDLVRFNGVLFKKDAFLSYIISILNNESKWNIWVETTAAGASKKTYKQLNSEYVELANITDGKVKILLKDTNPSVYKRVITPATATTEADTTFTQLDETSLSAFNVNLAEKSDGAIGYNGGLTYYNIPIEHLNNHDTRDGAAILAEGDKIPEAKYGVVRNHYYKVTVNKVDRIGHGIFKEDEVIVPGGGDDKDTYYVGANINILSWKIVSQTVGL